MKMPKKDTITDKVKAATTLLCAWPSFKFLEGIANATPIGVPLIAITPPRIYVSDAIVLSGLLILGLSHTSEIRDLAEALLLTSGPTIYIFMRQYRPFLVTNRIIYALLIALLIEAMIGKIVSSDIRVATFLTLEPSHSARIYATLLLILLANGANIKMIVPLSALFTILNGSVASLVFFLFYIIVSFGMARPKSRIELMVLVAPALLAAILLYATYFPNNRVSDFIERNASVVTEKTTGTSLSPVLQTAGGPRIAQAFAGFYLSTPIGHGLGEGRNLRTHAMGTLVDFSDVPYIMQRASAEPASYFSQLSYALGYVSVFVMIVWLASFIRFSYFGIFAFSFGLLQLVFFSTTTMPTPWFFLAASTWASTLSIDKLK